MMRVVGAARLNARRLLPAAVVAGVVWGFVMAWLAWRRDGAETVLLQGWILASAFGLGCLATSPRLGALAGLAVVAGAVWTYELLPGWGLEATLEREGASPAELDLIAARLDADDIVLLSTLMIGALAGLGGAIRAAAPPAPREASEQPAPPAPAALPAPEPPAPLWAGFESPRVPAPETPIPAASPPPDPPSPPVTPPDPGAIRRRIASSALLLAALGTDFVLDRVFGFYTEPQAALALVFFLAGLVGATVLARRLAPAAVLTGLVLAFAFGAVQKAEYDDRRPPHGGVLIR